jgi:type I pantothenate kinase
VSAAQELTSRSPYVAIDRADWAELAKNSTAPLTEEELKNIRGLGDFLDLQEVQEVYLPVSKLLSIYAQGTQSLHKSTAEYFGERAKRTPFIIAVAGSVAVGKSTVSRLLMELMKRWNGIPNVELITTDGFLYPNAELEKRGLMNRKGFPESYDRKRLLQFVADVKSGKEEVSAPVYSHLSYDILEGEHKVINSPDVLIVEGLNVLQPPAIGQEVALSDYFDFSIYIDAEPADIEQWYLERFKALWETAFTNPASYFHPLTKELSEEQAMQRATGFWNEINLVNLKENIEPTRSRAKLVMQKGKQHRVEKVLLRKI